jgi:hypothetical protein
MAPSRVHSRRQRDMICALAAGFAVMVAGWTFAAAFAPEEVDSLSRYSPFVYGPVATAVWGLLSAIAYLLISHAQRRTVILEPNESYHCRDFALAARENSSSICANLEEKTRLAAMTAGFALTISLWIAALSFMPGSWLDWLGEAPPGIYCIVSVILWAALSEGMYLVLRASRERVG